MGFILYLNEAVKGKKIGDPMDQSPSIEKLDNMLGTLSKWVDEIPPLQQSLRYGNPAFRIWFNKLSENAETLIREILPSTCKDAAIEITPYLMDSFGNYTRIDYGTGHETNFCAFLYCLAKLGVFAESDRTALVLVIFNSYLNLMRKLQTSYWLEPAGSHGVWGLDDYQFLPFIWGSGQFVDHPLSRPRSIHNPDVVEGLSDQYLYIGCIKFVKRVKKGPLAETSPIINDISALPNWRKVNQGLIKMYRAEVLSKFPIMQHFLFGSLMPFE